MNKKIELLSPAGDLERLKIAILYGADACYIGGKEFSLRANAKNFSIEEIKEACSYAHERGKKIYVTCNIIFHNDNLVGYKEYIKDLYKAKVDALIVGDPLLIPFIKKECPELNIYLSTQNSTTNSKAVQFWLDEGVEQVVLARELTKNQIKEIYDKTKAKLEVFIHGAMCTCYSGRCVLSNYFTNRDSNRGGCAQVCRFTFDLDKKRKTDFSIATKDLILAESIPDLIKIGVNSLKIEGRMRSLYYLATVNSSYRKLIDAYYNNNFTEELLKKELKVLSRVANRESTSQYFTKQVDETDQYYIGREELSNQDFLGIVIDYDKKTKIATIEQRNYFQQKDEVNIFGPNGLNFNFKIENILDENGNNIDCANHPQQIVKIKLPQNVVKDAIMRVRF